MSSEKSDLSPFKKFILIYIILALALFLPAWTILWLQGWIYIGLMIIFSTIYLTYLKNVDPELLKARAKTKATEGWDKMVGIFAGIFFILIYAIPGFDAVRYQWSHLPLFLNMIGFIGMGFSLVLFFLVNRENTYLSRIVEVQEERGHKVITTGPYKIVRHPMYLAVIILYLFHCLALGSLYALIPYAGLIITIVIRTIYEDKMLNEQLEGYKEYAQKTRYKLIPGIW